MTIAAGTFDDCRNLRRDLRARADSLSFVNARICPRGPDKLDNQKQRNHGQEYPLDYSLQRFHKNRFESPSSQFVANDIETNSDFAVNSTKSLIEL